jgi:hypothetical protein
MMYLARDRDLVLIALYTAAAASIPIVAYLIG